MTAKTKILCWLPVPGRVNKTDCYAVRGAHRWHVKKSALSHSTFYVLRFNGALIKRTELLREAQQHAERMAEQMESA